MHKPAIKTKSLATGLWVKANHGFTLLETVVALAIISIALLALLQYRANSIQQFAKVRDHHIAVVLAADRLYRLQQHMLNFTDKSLSAYGRNWTWQAHAQTTPNTHIKKWTISVFAAGKVQAEATLVGYQWQIGNE